MKTGFYLFSTDLFVPVLIFAVIKLDHVEVKEISWHWNTIQVLSFSNGILPRNNKQKRWWHPFKELSSWQWSFPLTKYCWKLGDGYTRPIISFALLLCMTEHFHNKKFKMHTNMHRSTPFVIFFYTEFFSMLNIFLMLSPHIYQPEGLKYVQSI